MEENIHTPSPSYGRITQGITLNTLIEETVDFVRKELPGWRDHVDRCDEISEEPLNSQLCDFLDNRARRGFQMARFHHEQRQTRDRRVDIAAKLTQDTVIEAVPYTIYEPFLVLEGKRLPAPSTPREREYVRGTTKKTGGIQRFKLGLHGAQCEVAVMIGYVQNETLVVWRDRINMWISELATASPVDNEVWDIQEQLNDFREDAAVKTAQSNSVHLREGDCIRASIQLYHLWIVMNQ